MTKVQNFLCLCEIIIICTRPHHLICKPEQKLHYACQIYEEFCRRSNLITFDGNVYPIFVCTRCWAVDGHWICYVGAWHLYWIEFFVVAWSMVNDGRACIYIDRCTRCIPHKCNNLLASVYSVSLMLPYFHIYTQLTILKRNFHHKCTH